MSPSSPPIMVDAETCDGRLAATVHPEARAAAVSICCLWDIFWYTVSEDSDLCPVINDTSPGANFSCLISLVATLYM